MTRSPDIEAPLGLGANVEGGINMLMRENYSGWINILLDSMAHQSLCSTEEIKTELYGSIAIAVQRGNTLIMDAGYHTTLREAGRMECSIGGIIEAAG